MVFGFLKGQFIDVIHWVDDSRDTMVWRFERHGHAIMYGAKLTVREGQAAVFVHEGQLADVFTPGLYMLETNNMPLMTALQHWDHGFSSPFKSEIYFVNTRRFAGMKWGTQNPIMLRDPEFGPLRLRAFGSYAIRVADPALFLRESVGTDGHFTTAEISAQIRNVIVSKASVALAGSGIPALDMAANKTDLGALIAQRIGPMMGEYGLEVPEFYIENISLPPEVEKVLDQRTSMGIVGDLGKYSQFAGAQAMQSAAANTGEAGGGMGAGLG
ncbi:MAG: SPFH domain-containing protein, partial [Rhodobacteraceae bacterium]|nr:SPFH domain-containing protein [Paracoccaceae bacterium]